MHESKTKSKILVVISGDHFIRNYLTTDALQGLEQNFDCHFVANSETLNRVDLEKKAKFRGYYTIDVKMKVIHQKILDGLMYLYRKRSRSFRYRIKRQTPTLTLALNGAFRRFHLRLGKWILITPLLLTFRAFLNIRFFSEWYLEWLKSRVHPNEKLKSFICGDDYRLIIFPSSAYDVDGTDVAWVCEQENLPSLFLIDNWDNISSKSVFWKKPKYLAVWGAQSKEQAVAIQKIASKDITLIGTPRFDAYFQVRNTDIESHFIFKYILFVGTALDFDEEKLLEQIGEVMENDQETWKGIKVIYRPHPWRQNACVVHPTYGRHVITDPQILSANSDKSSVIQPSLDYYPSLFKNAEFVMGGLTTMLIEGLIFRKCFLAFAHEDSRYITSMRNALVSYEHFKGLDELQSIGISYDKSDISRVMKETFRKQKTITAEEIDRDRMWYLYNDHFDYKERLLNLTNKIVD